MRSVIAATLLSLSLTAVGLTACTSTTHGTAPATNQDAGASSEGTTKKPSKLGAAVTGAKPDTKADAGSDVMPDPTPGLVPPCKGAALCVSDCPDNDEACFEGCMKGMPDDELAKFVAVGECINQSACDTDDCIQQACAAEIKACIGE